VNHPVLDLIDDSLESFFRATVPLSAQDVDVSFEPPERDWSAKLNRPTVNLFLWDIRRSTDRARSGVEDIERDGRHVRRLALPRVELRYLVTAWTSDHGDERALLAGLMRSILAHGEIPDSFVAEPLRALPPLAILMARATDDHMDVFKALEGQLKPGINMVVFTAVETDVFTPAGPPVEVFETRLGFHANGDREPRVIDAPAATIRRVAGEVADPAAVGVSVISPRGATTVNPSGRFLVAARPGDELVIETTPPRTVVVPPEGGVRVG
jgi:Pvc16 N-terminal domain